MAKPTQSAYDPGTTEVFVVGDLAPVLGLASFHERSATGMGLEMVEDRIGVSVLGDVVYISGEIDMATAPAFDAALAAVDGPALVDLSAVSFMSSSGIAVLVRHQQRRVDEGVALRVVAMSYPVRRVIEVCGLTRVLTDVESPLVMGS